MMRQEIAAPDRTVNQLTGEVAADSTAFFRALDVPPPVPADTHAIVCAQRDQYAKERDDAIAERDNMVDLAIEVGRIGHVLRHMTADRDDFRERADDWRDKAEMYLATIDELQAELAAMQQERDQAVGQRDVARAAVSGF